MVQPLLESIGGKSLACIASNEKKTLGVGWARPGLTTFAFLSYLSTAGHNLGKPEIDRWIVPAWRRLPQRAVEQLAGLSGGHVFRSWQNQDSESLHLDRRHPGKCLGGVFEDEDQEVLKVYVETCGSSLTGVSYLDAQAK